MSRIDETRQDVTPELAAVAAVVGAPDFIAPWLDRFYDRQDAELILAADAAATAAPRPPATAPARSPGATWRAARALRRAILDRDESGAYAPADFHERLEIWAMLEGWKDVPLAIHRQLADWDVDYYAQKIRADVEATRDGHPGHSYEARYSYVLLHEAEAIVAAQDHVYLWPCDCRSIVGKCRKTRDVCLRFENDRAWVWGSPGSAPWKTCVPPTRPACCTRPTCGTTSPAARQSATAAPTAATRTCAHRLDVTDAWPVRRYVAGIDMDLCKACGRCGLRCPFEAIVFAGTDGRPAFDARLCRGCGLCATGCSADAIELLPLAGGSPLQVQRAARRYGGGRPGGGARRARRVAAAASAVRSGDAPPSRSARRSPATCCSPSCARCHRSPRPPARRSPSCASGPRGAPSQPTAPANLEPRGLEPREPAGQG